jgi:putative sigma-54 modulation protein
MGAQEELMQINITFRHVEPSDSLKNYVNEKLERLKKYFDRVVEGHVVLSQEKIRYTAEITLSTNGIRMNAKYECADFHSAIDNAISRMERQLKRHKEKIKSHKPLTNRERRTMREQIYDYGSFETDQSPTVLKTEHYDSHHKSIDEAVMEIDLAEKDFLVFTDNDDKVKVVYKRDDGNYGLIEPE